MGIYDGATPEKSQRSRLRSRTAVRAKQVGGHSGAENAADIFAGLLLTGGRSRDRLTNTDGGVGNNQPFHVKTGTTGITDE